MSRWRARVGARCSSEEGFTLVFVALLAVVLFTFVAFVVDLGNVRQVRSQAQSAADAGALAGAQDLSDSTTACTAMDRAARYAGATMSNVVPSQRCSLGAASTAYTAGAATLTATTPYNGDALQIHVEVCQSVPDFFGQVVGPKSFTPCRRATAKRTTGAGRCGVCVLGPSGLTLTDTAGGNVTVKNSDVVVNSTGTPAANHTGGGLFTATNGTIGGPAAPGGFSGSYIPTTTNEAAVADPLAHLPQCDNVTYCTGLPSFGNVNATGTIQPGIYGNLSVSNSATLASGIYVITGSFHASNSQTLNMSSGVMLYFACSNYPMPCSSGGTPSDFAFTGGGPTLLAPMSSGTYAGLAIFFDRSNAHTSCGGGGLSTITAGGTSSITGTIYMADACLKITAGGASIGSSLVVNSLTLTGGGAVTIDPTTGINFAVPGGISLTE